ncbi:hypothetical protein Tco_1189413, partial [Tanacetum coccineum]
EEQNLDLSVGTPFNLKKDRIKTWIKDNVISRRPRLHKIASLQEISARSSMTTSCDFNSKLALKVVPSSRNK